MKKFLTTLLVFAVVTTMLFTLTACGEDDSNVDHGGQTDINTFNLSYNEQKIFDLLIEYLDDFKSPTSLRVLSVKSITEYTENLPDDARLLITLQGTNSYGGIVNDDYVLDFEDNKMYTSSLASLYTENVADVKVSNLNKALTDYFEEQGWL